ncbi:MAG: hypothetical protein GC190_19700 [Alphaproteobacteria bacterium]|nr:hypothetical protein [Alphaproteobacteria bacterium]
MPTTEIELACAEGAEARTVRLQLQADGAIRLHAYDKGATARLTFDRDEYEFWVTVPPEAVARLAFELLSEKYAGRLQAVTEFRDFCKSREIMNKFDTWS